MAANPEYANGEVIANKYVVEGFLGESPAGRTYLANGNFGSQKLCIKFYKPEVSARLLSAPDFFLKAGVMTEVEHDNLCTCLDVQEEMGLIFVARTFAEGQTFEDWARKSRWEGNYYSRGLELLWQICQGLASLHERTRHLNIHPGNMIVGPLTAKLCDWDPRALGNMEMTPDPMPFRPEYVGYRAPEAAVRGSFLSYPSSDLFSVAGLLFRLLKGEHPFVDPAQTLREVRVFDKDLAVFMAKALHPKPEERFQEASEFADALWNLQGAMQRLQERAPKPHGNTGDTPRREEPTPREAQPAAPARPAAPQVTPMREPTLFGGPVQKAAGNDTFFNFFPSPDTAVNPAEATAAKPQAAPKPSANETLFGAPPQTSARNDLNGGFGNAPAKPAPAFDPPKPMREPAPKSGLGDLEAPGTMFGSEAPLFSPPPKTPPHHVPIPGPAKPLSVSLSSLEKDPLDLAGNEAAGFTQFGFKGAGENRTGIFVPEQKTSPKRKLMILLVVFGVLVLLVGMAGLFLYLRQTAVPEVPQTARAPEPPPAPEPAPKASVTETPASSAPAAPAAKNPAPSTPKAAAPKAASEKPPAPATAKSNAPDGQPPMPVIESPEPKPTRPEQAVAANEGGGEAPAPKSYKSPAQGNSKITPEREAALLAMVQTRTWPGKAADRLKAANDLNDLGKTAEANMAYSKTLLAGDVNDKQKILALGGLAVTFESMGMRDQAKDAVDQILSINPKNGFALKMRDKLK